MEAQFVIDLATATPPYEQIQGQIVALIAVGELQAGARLPAVRSLAADLGVAAGTVTRAYRELEAARIVITNRRQGTVVAGSLPARPPGADGTVMAAVEHLIEEGERARLDGKMLITLLQGRLNQRGK